MSSMLGERGADGRSSSRDLQVCPVCCEGEGRMEGPLVETSWYVQYVVRERGGWKVL